MSSLTTNAQVLSKKIHRARRDHRLSISILAMLAGLTEEQVQSLETDAPEGFIEEAHRVHCASRLAVALGYPEDHFLEHHTPAAAPDRAACRCWAHHAPAPAADKSSAQDRAAAQT